MAKWVDYPLFKWTSTKLITSPKDYLIIYIYLYLEEPNKCLDKTCLTNLIGFLKNKVSKAAAHVVVSTLFSISSEMQWGYLLLYSYVSPNTL